MQRGVEPVAARVAGEHAAGAVRPVRTRGEADDHEAGAGVAEGRDRPAPVRLGGVGTAFLTGDALAVGNEPRAARAQRHAALEHGERPRGGAHRWADQVPVKV